MGRTLTFLLISSIAALASACGPATPAPDTAKADGTCEQPATPAKEGETPTCGEGCAWSGTECRAQRGVGIPQRPDATKPPPEDKDKAKP